MKKHILWCAAILLLAQLGTQCRVEEDPCENVDCSNHGNCSDGNCLCDSGYEGSNCGIETRAKFLGTYLGLQEFKKGPSTITAAGFPFTLSADSKGVLHIAFSKGFYATLDGNSGNLTFPNQKWGTAQEFSVTSGHGTVSQTSLSVEINGNDAADGGKAYTLKFNGTR